MTANFVEIWHGEILPEEPEKQDYYLLLNTDEKEKAAAFKRPEVEKKYIKTRGVLRKVLGNYINQPPQQLLIKTAEHGKPFIEQQGLYFNLSHTGNKFVIAVSNCGEVGVDIEQYRQRLSLSGLVDKCFSVQEKEYWLSLPEEQKTTMFYRFWVRKEAFVKAVGRGIALGLDQCVVNPHKQNHFLSIPDEYGLAADWKIVDIALNKEDVCAMVIQDCQFRYQQIELK